MEEEKKEVAVTNLLEDPVPQATQNNQPKQANFDFGSQPVN